MPPTQQANGEWTPQKPNYQVDETVWLQCSTGYELTDQKVSSVTCGKDTQWSTPSPTCRGKSRCSLRGRDKSGGKGRCASAVRCSHIFFITYHQGAVVEVSVLDFRFQVGTQIEVDCWPQLFKSWITLSTG